MNKKNNAVFHIQSSILCTKLAIDNFHLPLLFKDSWCHSHLKNRWTTFYYEAQPPPLHWPTINKMFLRAKLMCMYWNCNYPITCIKNKFNQNAIILLLPLKKVDLIQLLILWSFFFPYTVHYVLKVQHVNITLMQTDSC